VVHFVRAVLAGCAVCVDSFSICLAFVLTLAAYRDHDGGSIRAGSDFTLIACARVGLAKVWVPSLNESLTKSLK
jgi:hypothetical protein